MKKKNKEDSKRVEDLKKIIKHLTWLANDDKVKILNNCKDKWVDTAELRKELDLNPSLFYLYLRQLEELSLLVKDEGNQKSTYIRSNSTFEEALKIIIADFELYSKKLSKK